MLVTYLRALEDREFLSDTPAIAGARPEGILSAAPLFSAGSPGSLETVVPEMFGYVSNGQLLKPFFITSPRSALHLKIQHATDGALFDDVRVDGGHITEGSVVTW